MAMAGPVLYDAGRMFDPEFIRYRQMVAELARRALRPLKPQILGAPHGSLLLAAPAALMLLGDRAIPYECFSESAERLAQATALTDGAGQSRDVYFPLAMHLHLLALENCETMPQPHHASTVASAQKVWAWLTASASEVQSGPQDAAMALWRSLCQYDAAPFCSDSLVTALPAAVDVVLRAPGPGGSLHPMAADQSLDAWTYQELTGLHALTHLALRQRNLPWLSRVQETAIYHLENTQPDHTTNQPWGLPAFLLWEKTAMFGQQQIHDATAHGLGAADGREKGGEVDVVTGPLLADAAWLLARTDLAAMAGEVT
jgi:hypothetical protein